MTVWRITSTRFSSGKERLYESSIAIMEQVPFCGGDWRRIAGRGKGEISGVCWSKVNLFLFLSNQTSLHVYILQADGVYLHVDIYTTRSQRTVSEQSIIHGSFTVKATMRIVSVISVQTSTVQTSRSGRIGIWHMFYPGPRSSPFLPPLPSPHFPTLKSLVRLPADFTASSQVADNA